MGEFLLKVNGNDYGGWKSFSIQRSIEQVSGIFQLEVSDRWALNQERRPINPNDECELVYGNLTLIKGFVDEVNISYDAESHNISISGRDRTADLVDCSARYATGQLFNRDLLQVANLLSADYGVTATADVNIQPAFDEVTIDDGETIYEVIERLARHRGVLLTSDKGQLKITKPSNKRIDKSLMLGDNVKSCDATMSTRERFNSYLIKAQSSASDNWPGGVAAEPSATVTDNKIRKPRFQIVLAEESATSEDCVKRGKWHRNVQAARGTSLNYTVQGLEYAPGLIWRENRMVKVIDPFVGLNTDLLIVAVNYSKGESGTETTLTLAPREAYELLEVPESKEPF